MSRTYTWFRCHHGKPMSPKMETVARACNRPRHMVVAVYWCMYDYASQNEPRGSIRDLDREVIATGLDMQLDDVKLITATMLDKHMIDKDGRLRDFETDQRERSYDNSTERVRRYRERKKQGAGQGGEAGDEHGRVQESFPKDPDKYAWSGKVIRLTPRDYNAWKKAYPNVNLDGLLQNRDEWLSTQAPDIRKRWFQSTSSWLAKRDQEAYSERQSKGDQGPQKDPAKRVLVG